MRAAMIALLFVGACNSSANVAQCSADLLAQADVSQGNYVDCGEFTLGSPNYTDQAMNAAQLCVLNAVSNGQGFLLEYDANDASGSSSEQLRSGWTGVVGASGVTMHNYAGVGTIGAKSMKYVTSRQCTKVVAADNCTPAVGVPCLTCTGTDTGAIACRD